MKKNKYIIKPNINDISLFEEVQGLDHNNNSILTKVVQEVPLTVFLNSQEIVTLMTINDYPEYLAVGYLLNQNMIYPKEKINKISYDKETNTIVIRTKRKTNYERILKKKITTSGCAQGTIFGNIYEELKKITLTPSLYLEAGAIHGCVLCKKNNPMIYMEDVGRHNAVDKIAGYMFKNNIKSSDKIFYTTGRLTSEMIIKTVKMNIPILISRSGFTAWGGELAKKTNLTLIGRAKGKRYTVLSGNSRIY